MNRELQFRTEMMAFGKPVSTRLIGAISNFAWDMTLDEVIQLYRASPENFAPDFLRTPGAGRKTLNELGAWIDSLPETGDYTGRTIRIARGDADDMKRAIDDVLHSVSAQSRPYAPLTQLRSLLDASTLHVEQEDDKRPMFQLKKEK